MKISVITPVYKAEKCLNELYTRLVSTLEQITNDFEIIMVNDASPQNDWLVISELSKKDNRVKGINLSRNFGQHYAITAGLDYANGDWVVVMDCDLQDQPEEIDKLLKKANEGFDIVFGRRYERKDGFFKKMSSKAFVILFDYLSGNKTDGTIANFSISKKAVIEYFKKYREHTRSYPQFMNLIGFKRGYVNIEHAARFEGKSSYSLKKLFKFAINNIVAYSNKPLRLSINLGFTISLISMVYALYLMIRYLITGISIQGWTSIMVSLWFIAGLIFANMGILGLYIGKIFDEAKNRPIYIIMETIGIELKD